MKQKRIFIFSFLVLIPIIYSIHIKGLKPDLDSNSQPDLEIILKKCADYCEALSNSVLDFVCQEKIKEEIYHSFFRARASLKTTGPTYRVQVPTTEKNVYIYDYQLIRKENKIKERRTLLKENGKKKHQKNAPLKTKRFKHEHVIFGPIGLISKQWQQYYDYKIIKEEKYKREKVIVIEVVPKSSLKLDRLFGKIWVRKSDFSILKIEWNQTSMRNFKGIEETAKELNAKPRIIFISEYAFEKNRVRFPSKYSVKEEYIHLRWGRFRKSIVTVTYKNYKFFTVETEVKY